MLGPSLAGVALLEGEDRAFLAVEEEAADTAEFDFTCLRYSSGQHVRNLQHRQNLSHGIVDDGFEDVATLTGL